MKRMDAEFQKRIQRRLYYNNLSDTSRPSFPLTELAVDYFHDSVPDKLGHVDMYSAADVVRQTKVSPASMVLSMLYAKRLRQNNPEYLHSISSSDIFFISMMMASKYLYDEGVEEEVFNDEWADCTDLDVDYVNKLEMDFLKAMDWRLFVGLDDFESTLAAIERRLALQEGLKRGWFTYTELNVLLSHDLLNSLWYHTALECSKAVSTLSAIYLTGVLTLLGSTALAIQVSVPLSAATLAMFTPNPLPASNLQVIVNSYPPPKVNTGFGLPVIENNSTILSKLDEASEEVNALLRQVKPDLLHSKEAEERISSQPQAYTWSVWLFDTFLTQLLALTRIQSGVPKKSCSRSIVPQEKSNGSHVHIRYRTTMPCQQCIRRMKCSKPTCQQDYPNGNVDAYNCLFKCHNPYQSSDPQFDISKTPTDQKSNSIEDFIKGQNQRMPRGHAELDSDQRPWCEIRRHLPDDRLKFPWFHQLDLQLLTNTFSFHPSMTRGLTVT